MDEAEAQLSRPGIARQRTVTLMQDLVEAGDAFAEVGLGVVVVVQVHLDLAEPVGTQRRQLFQVRGHVLLLRVEEGVLRRPAVGDPNTHDSFDLPNIVIGSGNGKLKPGRHVAYEIGDYVPQANLLISLLAMVGVPVDKLGDSTGRLKEIA